MAYRDKHICITAQLTSEQKAFVDSYTAYKHVSISSFVAGLIDEYRSRPEVNGMYEKIKQLESLVQGDQDQGRADREEGC